MGSEDVVLTDVECQQFEECQRWHWLYCWSRHGKGRHLDGMTLIWDSCEVIDLENKLKVRASAIFGLLELGLDVWLAYSPGCCSKY